jgi:AMP nucleosidase
MCVKRSSSPLSSEYLIATGQGAITFCHKGSESAAKPFAYPLLFVMAWSFIFNYIFMMANDQIIQPNDMNKMNMPLKTKLDIARNWLPRYTGAQIDEIGDYILLTNFYDYVQNFAEQFRADIKGYGRPMQLATNTHGLSIINFGMGSSNAATIMDLLVARNPRGVLFLGKCGGLKSSTEIGHFILPIAAIRGDGTSNDYLPPEVPALPSFKLHKFISNKIVEHKMEYRTGVVYTTNRRLWEWDDNFKQYLSRISAIGIDMETATLFIVGHANEISRGALLLVSDMPLVPEGVKTEMSDRIVTEKFSDLHLAIGIEAMTEIEEKGEEIKHFRY